MNANLPIKCARRKFYAPALLVLAASVCGAPSSARAAIYTVNASTADQGVYSNTADALLTDPGVGGVLGTINSTGSSAGSITITSTEREITTVMPFALPTLAPGHVVVSARLELTALNKINTPGFNVDLVTFGTRAAATVLTSDGVGGTLVQDNFVTPSTIFTSGTKITTNSSGSASLGAFFNNLYVNGATPGHHAFLRIDSDITSVYTPASNVNTRYGFHSADAVTAANRPVLRLLTVSSQAAVTNGSFESPDTGSFTTTVNDWSTHGDANSVFTYDNAADPVDMPAAPDGDQWARMLGRPTATSLFQPVGVVQAGAYQLDFVVGDMLDTNFANYSVSLLAGDYWEGDPLASLTTLGIYSSTGNVGVGALAPLVNGGTREISLMFNLDSAYAGQALWLMFQTAAGQAPTSQLVLDQIEFFAVPEPAAGWTLAGLLVLAAAVGWRRAAAPGGSRQRKG